MNYLPVSEPDCVKILAELRWGAAPTCYKCGSTQSSKSRRSRLWNCRGCRSQFSVTQGTFLAKAHLDLPDWFAGITVMLRMPSATTGALAKEALLPFPTMKMLRQRFTTALDASDPFALAVRAFVLKVTTAT